MGAIRLERTTAALEWAIRQAWAVDEDTLRLGFRIACREQGLSGSDGMSKPKGSMTYRGNVAVIPVVGPIFRRANLFTQLSGGASSDTIMDDLRTAIGDRSVTGIVLNADSPGGQVTGTAELAELIYRGREAKPIVSFADGGHQSAMQWIGSAAHQVVASPTARLGSVGVVTKVYKWANDKDEPYIEMLSSNAENKRLNPESDAGRAAIQSEIDEMERVFHASLAKYRGVSEEKVRTGFGRGLSYVGEQAVRVGLADSVGTFEDVVAALGRGRLVKAPSDRSRSVSFSGGSAMGWREQAVQAIFGGSADSGEDGGVDSATRDLPARITSRIQSTDDDRLRAEMEAKDREIAALRRGNLDMILSHATAQASALVRDRKIASGLAGDVAMAYAVAALDDLGIRANVSLSGGKLQIADGEGAVDRRGMLDRLFAGRSESPMSEGVIPDNYRIAENSRPFGHGDDEDDDSGLAAAADRMFSQAHPGKFRPSK